MKAQLELLQESIFSQLDPILRQLLYSIEQELSLSSSDSANIYNSNSSTNNCYGNSNSSTGDGSTSATTTPSTTGASTTATTANNNTSKEKQKQQEDSLKSCQDILFLQNMQVELFQKLQSELEGILSAVPVVEADHGDDDGYGTRRNRNNDNPLHVDIVKEEMDLVRQNICNQMQRYILLPMILKLQNPSCHPMITSFNVKTRHDGFDDCHPLEQDEIGIGIGSDDGGSDDEDGDGLSNNILLGVRNSCRRSLECAASCLKILLQILLPSSSSSSAFIYMDVNVELKVKLMVALWTSLSYMVKEYLGRSCCHSHSGKSLDNGEECIYLLLECMVALCVQPTSTITSGSSSCCSSKGMTSNTFASNTSNAKKDKGESPPSIVEPEEMLLQQYKSFVSCLLSYMDGRFFILLVQCTVSILDGGSSRDGQENTHQHHVFGVNNSNSTAPFSSSYNHCDMYEIKSLDGRYLDMKGNVKLKVQVFLFMRVLMRMGTYIALFNDGPSKVHHHNLRAHEDEQSIVMTNLWRLVFPGVFKTLFRETLLHLRFTTSQSSSKLAMDLLETLSVLINRTMSITRHEPIHKMFHLFLNSECHNSIDVKSHSSKTNIDTTLQKFLDNVHSFLPRPLIMILRLIPLQKTTSVKISGAKNFCRSILIESRECWAHVPNDVEDVEVENYDESLDVMSVAFESLITMVVDPDETLTKECKMILRDYRNSLGESEWNAISKKIVIPRVINLIQSLPSYAKSGRESDLSSTLQLISGYLLSFVEDNCSNENKDSVSKTILSKFFYQKVASNSIVRQCVVEIFTIDSTNSAEGKIIQINGKERGSFQIPFKFFHGSTTTIAHDLIHNMRKVLGYKRTISLIEDCIAEFYAVLSDRINHNRSLWDTEQYRFVEKHIGLIVIAKELIAVVDPISNQKRRKLLNSLASTLIPLIVSEIMWQLPSVSLTSIIGLDTQPYSLTVAEISSDMAISPRMRTKTNDVTVSSEAMNGNSTVIVCLMDLIAKLALHLGPDFVKFVPLVLYPIVQKLSDLNSRAVQDAARVTLIKISDATSHFSVQAMLLSNYKYLMEILTTELSNAYGTSHDLRSQAICFHSLHGIIDLMLRNTGDSLCDKDIEDQVMLLTDMQRSIVFWFDRQFSTNTHDLLKDIAIPLTLTNVFTSISRFLHKCMSSHLPFCSAKVSAPMEQFCWDNMIAEFQTFLSDKDETKHEAIDAIQGSQMMSLTNSVSAYALEKLTVDIEQVLLANATFISLPYLKLQVNACELFLAAFELLHSIQQHAKLGKELDNANNTGNLLLQSVSKHWPTIDIRFQKAVLDFTQHPSNNKHESTPRRHSAVLLCSLLGVVNRLSLMCGDFVIGRFSSSIWPQMSKILTYLLSQNHNERVPTYSETDSLILISILSCIAQTFTNTKCGMILPNMTSHIGTMLLPFLSCDDKIGEEAMCAIREILRLDCDCLWRPFLSLSKSAFPERPLLPFAQQHSLKCIDLSIEERDSLVLTQRVKSLIVFVQNLPEQHL